jgi:DNA-binding NarL/FixJ family response regulator
LARFYREEMIIEKLLPCEVRVVEFIAANGKTLHYHEVGRKLGLTNNVVKHYMANAMRKTGTFSRLELIMNWHCPLFRLGLKGLGIL